MRLTVRKTRPKGRDDGLVRIEEGEGEAVGVERVSLVALSVVVRRWTGHIADLADGSDEVKKEAER